MGRTRASALLLLFLLITFVNAYHARQMAKRVITIPTPSPAEVNRYLQKWDSLENYVWQEEALDKLFFDICPDNTDMNDILIKVATLNDFYSTYIYNIFAMAKHIQSLDIDSRLRRGDASLVEEIASVTIKGKAKRFYSFASKYCSHHKPKQFPIYDYYVEEVLVYFRKKDKFSTFRRDELKKYDKFISVLEEFQDYYGLRAFDKKDLDRYLWQLGKDFFPRNYSTKKKKKGEAPTGE